MPRESKFFTVKRVLTHSQAIRCTPGAVIGTFLHCLLIEFRGAPAKCQVTKGAHVWSWHKTCNPNDLRDLGSRCGRCSSECGPNVIAQSSCFFHKIFVTEGVFHEETCCVFHSRSHLVSGSVCCQ